MSTDDPTAVVRRHFEEIWNLGHLDRVDALFAPDFRNFGQPCPRERVRQIVAAWRTAFPDLHYTVEAELAEGDRVLAHATLTGTHVGRFVLPGKWDVPPTGKQVNVRQMHLCRVRENRIVEHWAVRDDLGLFQQLGVVSLPGQAG